MFLMLLPLCGITQVIFKLYIFTQIFEKREQCENMSSTIISTFTVLLLSFFSLYVEDIRA